MAIELITVGLNANCYVSTNEADEYFKGNALDEEWNKIPDKEKYLINACRDIDRQLFRSSRANPLQSLFFPRKIDKGIPVDVKRAACEQALYRYLNEDKFIHFMNAENGISSFNQGKNQRAYDKNPELLCVEAKQYLKPFFLKVGGLK